MKRTIVFHFGALGDFILSWPALGLLMNQQNNPYHKLDLVGHLSWSQLIFPISNIYDRESYYSTKLFFVKNRYRKDN